MKISEVILELQKIQQLYPSNDLDLMISTPEGGIPDGIHETGFLSFNEILQVVEMIPSSAIAPETDSDFSEQSAAQLRTRAERIREFFNAAEGSGS